jgi:hypothetical protein
MYEMMRFIQGLVGNLEGKKIKRGDLGQMGG